MSQEFYLQATTSVRRIGKHIELGPRRVSEGIIQYSLIYDLKESFGHRSNHS